MSAVPALLQRLALPRPGVVGFAMAVQFVCLLDFMAMLPLGADLSRALGFPASRVGALSLAYTLGSAGAGLLAVRWLDRLARRRALLCCLGGFALATLATALSGDLAGLLAARALTGLFGGPTVALVLAMVVDATAPAQRGRAIGRVMTAFPLAVVAGVPASLEAARWGDWRTPFLLLAALVVAVLLWAWRLAPLRCAAGPAAAASVSLRRLLARPAVRLACLLQFAAQFSTFLVVPQFSAWYLLNLGFPRDRLGLLYAAGGVVALLAVAGLGALADRLGPARGAAIGTAGFLLGLTAFGAEGWLATVPAAGGMTPRHWLLALPFIALMAGNAGRNVCLGTATSCVPGRNERAGFMSLQSLVQDIGIGAAAAVSCLSLGATPAGALTGVLPLAVLAGAVALLLPRGIARLGWRRER